MRVLFVTNVFEDYVNREPLGIGYLSASLRKAGHETEIAGTREGEAIEKARTFSPRVLAYSITTGFHREFLAINRELKKATGAYSVFGGPHATFFPEVIEEEGVDAVCIGEGEEALVELAGALERGTDPAGTRNWWVKNGDGIEKAPLRPLKQELDEIPSPDRDLFYGRFERARRARIKSFLTARGCPYRCSYCFNGSFRALHPGEKTIRSRSVDSVIEEVRAVRALYPLNLAYFVTDIFNISDEWVEELAAKYPRGVGVPFHCLVRPDRITDRSAEHLARAGCVSVMMGIEAGNERLRREVLGRPISDSQILDAARHFHSYGVRVCTQNMLGLPGGSLDCDLETLEMNIRCRADYCVVSILQPYPRTAIHEHARRLGLFDGDIERIGVSYYDDSPLKIPQVRRVKRLQRLLAFLASLRAPTLVARVLIALPLDPLYDLVYKLWKGYCGKTRIFPHRQPLRETIVDFGRYIFGPGVR